MRVKKLQQLIPPVIRARVPERLLILYRAFPTVPGFSQDLGALSRVLASHQALTEMQPVASASLQAKWHWQVPVLGLIRREIEETIDFSVAAGPNPVLRLVCSPQSLHEAHAAGFGGVLAFTAASWFVAGIRAATATLLGGSLIAFMAREHSLIAVRARLKGLAVDVGIGLWPDFPGEVELVELRNEYS